MITQDEISKAKKAAERAHDKVWDACRMLENKPVWDTPKCKEFIDGLFAEWVAAAEVYRKLVEAKVGAK